MAIITGGEIGQVVDKGVIVEKQYQPVDTDKLEYCWLHSLDLTSDWKNPSPEDKKKLDKIRLKESQVVERDGTVKKFRVCPKCWNVVYWTKPK